MFKTRHCEVVVLAGAHGLDRFDDNVDVEVQFGDGSRYMATFFTLQNIQRLMDNWAQSGECLNGLYFWASDMVLVRELSQENIAKVIADLIEEGEFSSVFCQALSS